MIPQAHITAWRATAPWGDDAQVEQDLVLSRAVVEIFAEPELAGCAASVGIGECGRLGYTYGLHQMEEHFMPKQRRNFSGTEKMVKGSYQVEASDEGLMSDDIEASLRPVLRTLRKCDLPAAEVIAWCAKMIKRDRVGFLCDQELRALRQRFETSRSP